jgi:hypothetical protein
MNNVVEKLRRAITTASNDGMSEPGTVKRERHVERLATMSDAIDEIERLRKDVAALRAKALEEAAALVRQIGDPSDTSDIGEAAAEAFNALDGQSMSLRLAAWNNVIAQAIHDLAPPLTK